MSLIYNILKERKCDRCDKFLDNENMLNVFGGIYCEDCYREIIMRTVRYN